MVWSALVPSSAAITNVSKDVFVKPLSVALSWTSSGNCLLHSSGGKEWIDEPFGQFGSRDLPLRRSELTLKEPTRVSYVDRYAIILNFRLSSSADGPMR